MPDSPRIYKSKTRNAQEAHEAIRPTDVARTPESMRESRARHGAALRSDLEAHGRKPDGSGRIRTHDRSTSKPATARTGLRANGSVLTFEGFLALYQEGRDDPADDEDSARLPKVAKGDGMNVAEVKPEQHFTEPPPRFSEASLVKKLEELGIGRPSTYASILQVLRDRSYVRMERPASFPKTRACLVTAFLTNFFKHYVQYDFTARPRRPARPRLRRQAEVDETARRFLERTSTPRSKKSARSASLRCSTR